MTGIRNGVEKGWIIGYGAMSVVTKCRDRRLKRFVRRNLFAITLGNLCCTISSAEELQVGDWLLYQDYGGYCSVTYDSWRIRFQVSAMHLENTNVDLSIQKNILGGWEDWTSVRDSVPSILRINGKKVGQFYFDYDSQFDELRLTDGMDGGKLRMDTVESFVNKFCTNIKFTPLIEVINLPKQF